MEKLPISIGILAWNSGQTLVNTLHSYFERQFLHQVNDVCILFQEFSQEDSQIAEHFNIPYIAKKDNIGIGQAFIELTEQAKTDNVLVLEHDWKLIEDKETTRKRNGIEPTSRKFAGFPPCNFTRSMVPIARPAPLTIQPIFPSSAT